MSGGQDWEDSAACRSADPALFWPLPSASPARIRLATAVCDRCPSRAPCLEYALAHSGSYGKWGIWGGLTELERRRLKRRRRNRAA